MTAANDDHHGSAFLVIANGVAPEALDAYEDWHGGEHVPERLTMPGFLAARRFASDHETGRHFLTIYELDGVAALNTPEYRHLLAHPTPASLRMRPLMRDVRRLVYRETARFGAGGGGHLGFLRWANEDGAEVASGIPRDGILALRTGLSHQAAAHPAFAPDPAAARPHAVALVEAAQQDDLAAVLDAMGETAIERSAWSLIRAS